MCRQGFAAHSRRSIMARSASPQLAASLEVPEGTALLVIENIVYDQDVYKRQLPLLFS